MAKNIFSKLTKLYPNSDKAWSGLGITHKKSNKLIEATDAFSRALKINIKNETAIINLLEVSYELNKFNQIETVMKKYLELYPLNINILFGLAGVQYQSNYIDEAQETLNAILSIDSKHEDAIQMLDKIYANKKKLAEYI